MRTPNFWPRAGSRGRVVPATALLLALSLSALIVGCGTAAEPSADRSDESAPADSAASPVGVEVIAEGLDAPWSVAFHNGTALISERDTARILELGLDGGTSTVATIDGVSAVGEAGLLGLAARDARLYVYSTATGGNRIQRYPIEGAPGGLRLGEPTLVFDGIPAANYHDGGRIAFGPDGMLYVTTGDAGNPGSAQELGSVSGKILRLTPDGEVPQDNPFPGSPVYSLGHRNPQGIAWDDDGTMYAAEFGQNTWDELNIIEAGGNYGWPEVEGLGGGDRYIDPVQQWQPRHASPSGIAVYDGSVWIANLRGERLLQVPLSDLGSSTEHLGDRGRLRDVVVGHDGTLWVLTNNTDGRGDPQPGDDHLLRFTPDSD
ncbi:PQQ-dependent sugar dehydrogenase [Mycolicibacterium brumae]|uniref:Glucose dehydrogenase n=1 Tax=Mycolicibacterium brumae TaxID=85968 RepID=A0A2G5P4W8_9MYCO|nr:PQQ-dependent sugar dehydrogenase [Mycolicibacterium brumae]MCV7191298.1 PQQ-dependent sugar dehydrogenase [Mycolicibacterium brumae]PIB73083.1 glucose dehydrogenase [Mycolicibacterium brumae]UWW08297.1 PQQ-dependent sugar dehydrogenase [Mycolicibacterium brumae]